MRTAASIWPNADKEHYRSNPKMPLHTTLRVSTYCFAWSLHAHSPLPWKCNCSCLSCLRRYRIAVVFQICAITLFTVEFGKNCNPHSSRCIVQQHPYICGNIACHSLRAYGTLHRFFVGFSHNGRSWCKASERQVVTSCVATRCWALKAFREDFFLFILVEKSKRSFDEHALKYMWFSVRVSLITFGTQLLICSRHSRYQQMGNWWNKNRSKSI